MERIYEYIYVIHQTGSFKKAAEKLHVTQPALSIAIKNFENQLGAMVFDRRKHPFEPTPAGKIIIRNIKKIYHDERRMKAELVDLLELNVGDLYIGTTHYVNTCVLPPIINKFMDLYPNIKIILTEKSSSEVVREFLDDVYDVAFYANKLNIDFAMQIPVLHENLYWVIPNKFLDISMITTHAIPLDVLGGETQTPPLTSLSLLNDIPLIALMPGDRLFDQAIALFQEEKIKPCARLNVPQSTTAWHMACAGIGAALIPEQIIKSIPPADADISVFSFSSSLMKRTILACCKTNQYISNATKNLLSLCNKIAL